MYRFLFFTIALLVLSGFVKAQEKEPQTADDYVTRGLVRFKKADFDGAIADFDRALVLNPGNAATYSHRRCGQR